MTKAFASLLLLSLALLAASCGPSNPPDAPGGGRLPESEAKAECEKLRGGATSCWNDDVMRQCVTCLAQCGLSCSQAESCPLQFICPR